MIQPHYILENRVPEQDFEKMVYQWLAEGDYTPDDIIENIITQNNVFLMPLYFSKDEYYGSCSVSLGYRRTEYYYEWDDFNKRQVRKSRTVTDWYPHSQNIQGITITTTYAGVWLKDDIVTFIDNMGWEGDSLIQITSDVPRFPELCNLFQVTKEEAWNSRGGRKAYMEALKQTRPKLPSSLQSDLTLDIRFSERTFFSLLAPYWVFMYEYKEEQYYVVVDGHNPNRIEGIKPEDKKRKNHVLKIRSLGCLTTLLAITLVLYFINGQDFDKIELEPTNIIVFILFGSIMLALINKEVDKVKDKSKRHRQSTLSKKMKQLKQ